MIINHFTAGLNNKRLFSSLESIDIDNSSTKINKTENLESFITLNVEEEKDHASLLKSEANSGSDKNNSKIIFTENPTNSFDDCTSSLRLPRLYINQNNMVEVFIDINDLSIILPNGSNSDEKLIGSEKDLVRSVKNVPSTLDLGQLTNISSHNCQMKTCSNINHQKIHFEKRSDFKRNCEHRGYDCKEHRNNACCADRRTWLTKVVCLKEQGTYEKNIEQIDKGGTYNFSPFRAELRRKINQRKKNLGLFKTHVAFIDNNFQNNSNNKYKNFDRQRLSNDCGSNLSMSRSSVERLHPTTFGHSCENFNRNYNCNGYGKPIPPNNRRGQGQNCCPCYQCCQPDQRSQSYSDPYKDMHSPGNCHCDICNKGFNQMDNCCPQNEDCGCDCGNECTCSSQERDCTSHTVYCESSISSNCDMNDCLCPCPCRCAQFPKPPPYCLNSTYRMNYFPKCIPKFRRYKECDNLRLPLC